MFGGFEQISFASARLFLFIFARCAGTVWFAPALGGADFSKLQKFAVSFLLAALVFPTVSACVDAETVGVPLWTAGAIVLDLCGVGCEVLLGAALGLLLKVFFQGLYLAGETIARLGGVSVSGSFDPTFGGETTAPSSFLFWLAMAVFIVCGGLEAFLDGFLAFFTSTPPGGIFDAALIVDVFTRTLISAFVLGLRLSAPVICTTAVVYLGVSFNGRFFSQLNLSLVSFNLNAILTLTLLLLCIGVTCQVFQSELENFLDALFRQGLVQDS